MVINFVQSFSFVCLSLSFERNSSVINVATPVIKEVHPAIGTPKKVPTPVRDSDEPTVTPLIHTTNSNSVI